MFYASNLYIDGLIGFILNRENQAKDKLINESLYHMWLSCGPLHLCTLAYFPLYNSLTYGTLVQPVSLCQRSSFIPLLSVSVSSLENCSC
jgi:hypothetical protein